MDVVTVPELCDYVNSLKVAELKEHIKAFNERLPFSPHLRLSGNKPQLAERVIETIVAASQTPQYYQELLVVLAPLGLTHWLGDLARMRHASGQCVLRHSPRYAASYGRTPTGAALAAPSLSLAAPVQSRAEPVPAVTQGSLKQLRFRRSPFYDVVEFASSIVQIPEAPPPSGRRQVGVSFTLSAQQVSRLLDTQYVRLLTQTPPPAAFVLHDVRAVPRVDLASAAGRGRRVPVYVRGARERALAGRQPEGQQKARRARRAAGLESPGPLAHGAWAAEPRRAVVREHDNGMCRG